MNYLWSLVHALQIFFFLLFIDFNMLSRVCKIATRRLPKQIEPNEVVNARFMGPTTPTTPFLLWVAGPTTKAVGQLIKRMKGYKMVKPISGKVQLSDIAFALPSILSNVI